MRLGSDPEVFLLDPKTSKHLSVVGRVGGTKEQPLNIKGLPKGFTLQEDNVALEMGIPPARTEDMWVKHIQKVFSAALKAVPNLTFSKESFVIFDKDQMQTAECRVFGCEPDFNAWTLTQNPKIELPHPYARSAGGHIHVETKANKVDVVRAMDLYLGIPSLLMDKDDKRRALYGKPGAYRPKPYGVEYRTLSNFWIFDEKYIRWAWRQTELAETYATLVKMPAKMCEDIPDIINTGDKARAEKMCKQYKLEVV